MIKRDTLQTGLHKPIRSFVPREGRMTDAHRLVLQELWPIYGLSLQHALLDMPQLFGRNAPLTLEIGFGDGRSLLNLAKQNPQQDYIGIEVYRTGIAKLLTGIKNSNLTNIRIFCADAIEVLTHCIPDNCLQEVQLYFPDPWPKARHHKRRIVQSDFVALVAKKLLTTGTLHMATDWEEYAFHMLEVMEQQKDWYNSANKGNFAPRPITRPLTKFEQRGQLLGHGTWDLIFHKGDRST
jgi:tRNA (guanine-N7-)-methyltransferase